MDDSISREEIKKKLAAYYRGLYDRWYQLTAAATAAARDDDEAAFRAINRRTDKTSDFMDGVKNAAGVLGIGADEFLNAVNADRPEGE